MSHVLASSGSNTAEVATFWVLFVIAVSAALGMILTKRVVHCAVLLAIVMLILAAMYAMQGAPFLAFVQVIVYTGAVLMLFLFVMMIVGVSAADSLVETIKGQRFWAGLAAIASLVLVVLVVGHVTIGPAAPTGPSNGSLNVNSLATLIFTRYVFPFEVTSALLITAALGAMVLAHRERTGPRLTQRALSRSRVASGRPTPLPGPGTYALHNSVDTPALLPDGSQSRLSVSGVLANRALDSAGPQGRPTGTARQRTATEAGEPSALATANGMIAISEMDKSRAEPGGTPEHDETGEES